MFFCAALEDVFTATSLKPASRSSGNLTRGSVKSEPFIVNKDDLYLKIVHSWDPDASMPLRVKLKAPDGTIIDPTRTQSAQNKNSVTSIPFPWYKETTLFLRLVNETCFLTATHSHYSDRL